MKSKQIKREEAIDRAIATEIAAKKNFNKAPAWYKKKYEDPDTRTNKAVAKRLAGYTNDCDELVRPLRDLKENGINDELFHLF